MTVSSRVVEGAWPCPRCKVRLLVGQPGEVHLGIALSRSTRDEGAGVDVCSECGDREAMREGAGWGTVPLADWPLTIDELLREDRLRYTQMRTVIEGLPRPDAQ